MFTKDIKLVEGLLKKFGGAYHVNTAYFRAMFTHKNGFLKVTLFNKNTQSIITTVYITEVSAEKRDKQSMMLLTDLSNEQVDYSHPDIQQIFLNMSRKKETEDGLV